MNTIYYLNSCNTCNRIINELNLDNSFNFRELKNNPINNLELISLHKKTGSYEALFNKRALLFREKRKIQKKFNEQDYKKLILEHYTFLKRPILIIKNRIFIGNSKLVILEVNKFLNEQ